ncbi:MAG: hypothetical protein IJU59_04450 [Firmicutes bacterium]|nr:hypothetical protein [Bacillota bacterium]
MKKNKKAIIILYILILVGLSIAIYAVPKVTGALTPTVIVEYGSLQTTDRVTVYFSRYETVYAAGQSGSLNYYVSQDTQIRKGAKVLSVSQGTAAEPSKDISAVTKSLSGAAVSSLDYAMPANGSISFFADGYEPMFAPENLLALSFGDMKKVSDEPVNLTRETANRGEPLFKLCDYTKWYITTWILPGDTYKYEVGNRVQVALPDGTIPATVTALEDEGDEWQLILETNRYYDGFSTVRSADATIIASDYSGVIIPNECITTVDEQTGVYIKDKKGEYNFTPIKIITSDGTNSVAYSGTYTDSEGKTVGTIDIYDEILRKPL